MPVCVYVQESNLSAWSLLVVSLVGMNVTTKNATATLLMNRWHGQAAVRAMGLRANVNRLNMVYCMVLLCRVF